MSGQSEGMARKVVILRAAERLLVLRGWQKTTVAQIAQEADIAVGSVYLEFSSKARIMGELASQKYAHVLRQMRLATMRQGSYSERLRHVMNARTSAFIEMLDPAPHTCDLLSSTCGAVEPVTTRFMRAQRELLADFVALGVEEGAFAPLVSVPRTVDALLTAYAQFAPPQLSQLPEASRRDALEAMHDLILGGLEAK